MSFMLEDALPFLLMLVELCISSPMRNTLRLLLPNGTVCVPYPNQLLLSPSLPWANRGFCPEISSSLMCFGILVTLLPCKGGFCSPVH